MGNDIPTLPPTSTHLARMILFSADTGDIISFWLKFRSCVYKTHTHTHIYIYTYKPLNFELSLHACFQSIYRSSINKPAFEMTQ